MTHPHMKTRVIGKTWGPRLKMDSGELSAAARLLTSQDTTQPWSACLDFTKKPGHGRGVMSMCGINKIPLQEKNA